MGLEDKLKSDGEKKIAEFLEKNNIKYEYERPILVEDKEGKLRLWYPDFYLPEFDSYIEYFGMEEKEGYDPNYKMDVYNKNEYKVISVFPDDFKGKWQYGLVKKINEINKERSIDFYSKFREHVRV